MKPSDVLAQHGESLNGGPNPDEPYCVTDGQPWPCDAVDQARQLREAQERVAAVRRHIERRLIDLRAASAYWESVSNFAEQGGVDGDIVERLPIREQQPANVGSICILSTLA